MLKRIKLRYIWISIAVAFVLAIALIFICTQVKGNWNNVVIVFLAITFIYLTVAIQYASMRTFRYKAKPIVYPTISYTTSIEDFPQILKNLKFDKRTTSFGSSNLLISNKTAYKVVLINDVNKYFNQEETETNTKPNKELSKCEKFIAFELFFSYDQEALAKFPDFSIQGKNIYYTAFYWDNENKQFKCPNYVKPEDHFVDPYNTLLNYLAFNEVKIIDTVKGE